MNIEKIYKLIKDGSSHDFYYPNIPSEPKFISMNDISVVLCCVGQEETYEYNYFYDENHQERALDDDYDNLVKQVCKVKNFPETYSRIKTETWAIQYNGISIYSIDVLKISNLSSLNVYMPLTLEPHDFVVNLCNILNDTYRGSMSNIETTIHDSLKIKTSTFEDFLNG